MKIRKSHERGTSELDWLQSKHSFSFGEYYDPAHMGYRSLRVINDDLIAPGKGFGMHGHRDMEIISLVFKGELAHKDSLGHGATLRPGEVQVMSAGTGIRHSEFNPSPTESVHLLQIWITPKQAGLTPSYAQRSFATEQHCNQLLRVAGPKRSQQDNALPIAQDADLYVLRLEAGQSAEHKLAVGRGAWIQVVQGDVAVNGTVVQAGDGAAIDDSPQIAIRAESTTELILFDLL
jgi:redox-sensitive bicupin YhaK (pirin superfamily)